MSSIDNGHEAHDSLPKDSSQLYHINPTNWHCDYNITTQDKQQLYYVDNSVFTPNKPDLTVHMGTDKKAPVAAVCKFMNFSRHFRVGLGDPQNPNQVDWEEIVSHGLRRNNYRWEMNVPGGRHAFIWKRTHSVGVEDASFSSISNRNFKLVDEQTERVLAVFTNSSLSIKETGVFQFHVSYGREFDLMALLTALALYEKERRRRQKATATASGGSGG